MDKFLEDVKKEAEKAVLKHGDFHSLHEAYSVTLEEMDEWWEHVKMKQSKRDHKAIYDELVQIAACCVKASQILKYHD